MALEFLRDNLLRYLNAETGLRHFRRIALLESFRNRPTVAAAASMVSERLLHASAVSVEAITLELASHDDGLTETEAEEKLEHHGLNEVEQEKPMAWWVHLWRCYSNPFNLLLTLLAAVSYASDDLSGMVVIVAMVVLSTALRFAQESRSNRAADRLKEMVSTKATVLRRDPSQNAAPEASRYFGIELHVRPARRLEIPIRLLVPGDQVILAAGDMIPADVRVLVAKDLFVSQAALTGEALPAEKYPVQRTAGVTNPLELDNICYMGTNVVSGSATAIVVATGGDTYFGALALRVTAVDRAPTAFQAGVNKVTWLLLRFMMVMTPLVFLINGFIKHDWGDAFLFAIAVAVGLTPEMLPMIVTSTLAKGAVMLSRKKVIVKRLDAIQNFGAMDVLCTDKTGTLTQDKIFLERHTDAVGDDSDTVLEHAEMNQRLGVVTNYRKVDEVPFDFERRRMSVIVSEREDHHELICKGAVEEILSVCSHLRHNGEQIPLNEASLKEIREITGNLNREGLRVVAVAAKDLPPVKEQYSVADESELTLIGHIAFLDPPKESTAPALAALREHGVTVKILTGDNELVTAKICKEVGLPIDGILLGPTLEGMSDAELAIEVERRTVFARLTPAHKERVVRMLHSLGHVVGFMGDGINDAPALRAADIGISVDSAVDIAKEAADLILLEKSLLVLEEGVLEGRRTFANMLKYVKMTASSNFGNVFSVLAASAFLPFLPMIALQILVQNLLYDISQIAIPFDNVDSEFLARPQNWRADDIGRFMLFFGPVSSVFDIVTFIVMWFVFHANSPAHQTLFQSAWFVEGLVSQTLVVHMIRTRRIPFIQSRAGWPLIIMTLLIVAIGITIPMSSAAAYFKMQALPLSYFAWLVGIILCYMLLTQAMKSYYSRRFGWQ
jgi:Mg2+-importing ATPase